MVVICRSIFILVRRGRSENKSHKVAVDWQTRLQFDVGGVYLHLVLLRRERSCTEGIRLSVILIELGSYEV